ncbi:MAG: ribonuclease P protein component [Xanthobacteraceae bacterium]
MDRLKRRADFLATAKGARVQAAPFMVQARDRRDRGAMRIGLTVTKQTGNSVERNRIRRRLRAAANVILPQAGRTGFDYVLVARRPALTAPFDTMLADLERALVRVHAAKSTGPGRDRSA